MKTLEPAPEAHESAKEYTAKREAVANAAAKKPAGAYRPPHARGSAALSSASSLYQKELENNMKNGTPPPPGLSRNGGGRVRTVPGAAPVVEKGK